MSDLEEQVNDLDDELASANKEVIVDVDWDSLVYTSSVPQSLFCPVCKNVLLTPLQTSCEYKHTLCARCITRSLEDKLECPVDRSEMPGGLEDCCAAPILIQQVLDELEVACPNDGCEREMSRAMISLHMKEECLFQMVPCPARLCTKYSLRGECGDRECLHDSFICEHCHDTVFERLRADHMNECRALSHECGYCHQEFDMQGIREHREACDLQPVDCTASEMGCKWHGRRHDRQQHLDECNIQAMRPWLLQQMNRVTALETENRFLRSKVEDFQQRTKTEDNVIEVSSAYERDRNYLFETLESLSTGLENLSTSITATDHKNNHLIMSESMRMKDEITMLRGGIQALRLQWHHFVQNTRGPVVHSGAPRDRDSDRSNSSSARVSPTRSANGDGSRVKL